MSLTQALKQIDKQFGANKVMPASKAVGAFIQRIPTGSLSLDIESGGGWIQGKVNEVFGPYSGGKTFIALSTVAACQKKYPEANFAWMDAEGAFDKEWAKTIGVDLDRLLFFTPEYMEEALDISDALIKSEDIFLLVIDSWAALSPKTEFNGTMEDQTMGLRARVGNKFIRKSRPKSDLAHEGIDLGKTTLLVINQVYSGIGPYAGEETPGGRQLGFLAMLRIRIRRSDLVQDPSGTVICQQSSFVIEKNKTHPPKTKGEFWFSLTDNVMGPAGSISRLDELVRYGITYGVIKQAGAWFNLPEFIHPDKFQGKANMIGWIAEQGDETIDALEKLVHGAMRKGEECDT